MLHNPFAGLKKREWCLWIISLLVVAVSNILAGKTDPVTISATLIGVTALIFVARGDVWGQILTVVFSVLYAITSYSFRYYGEMITYMGMTAPIAVFSIITWIKNPSAEEKNTVRISRLSRKTALIMVLSCVAVTAVFGYVLKLLDTPNLVISTISIVTSYLASYLMMYRISYYALAYAANDVVLIIMWVLASLDNIAYLPMIACFLMFLANDIYGFVSWKKRERKQTIVQNPHIQP
ncbi:MAG: nicotinamide mononucleotide transporter [Oscillospiraceae bacterium]|nr:nicotinamide mononucleotide transporter [Oscillospiraceae bacterium]